MTFDTKTNNIFALGKDYIYEVYDTDKVIPILVKDTGNSKLHISKSISDPSDIGINSFSNKLYVTDHKKNSTLVINLNNDHGYIITSKDYSLENETSMKYSPLNIFVNNKTNTNYESLDGTNNDGYVAVIKEKSPLLPWYIAPILYLTMFSFIFIILFLYNIFGKRDKLLFEPNNEKISKGNIKIINLPLSNKSMALLSLIFMPLILVTLYLIQNQILFPIVIGNDIYLPNAPLEIMVFNYFVFSVYLSVIILIFIYPPYPFSKSIYNYYMKTTFKECVEEYELIKKILWISIPILILVTIYPYIHIILEKFLYIHFLKMEQNPVYVVVELMSLCITLSGVSKITFTTFFKKRIFPVPS